MHCAPTAEPPLIIPACLLLARQLPTPSTHSRTPTHTHAQPLLCGCTPPKAPLPASAALTALHSSLPPPNAASPLTVSLCASHSRIDTCSPLRTYPDQRRYRQTKVGTISRLTHAADTRNVGLVRQRPPPRGSDRTAEAANGPPRGACTGLTRLINPQRVPQPREGPRTKGTGPSLKPRVRVGRIPRNPRG